jgi:hypothetical protein
MARYSSSSQERFDTLHPDLQLIFNKALDLGFDHAILEGHRSREKQLEYYRDGRSKVRVSKHNRSPSEAVDARPYVAGLGYPDDLIYFYHFGGVIMGIAAGLGIRVRWGGDWDSDRDFGDQTFMDLVHFELV